MDQATCHFCERPVNLIMDEGNELVMESHLDSDGEFCSEGSGERPIAQREITD